jgi:deoxyribose-phosphate aldolase
MIDNSIIDYTLLDNNASDIDIISLCKKAILLNVRSICVMPKHVKIANQNLVNTSVLVCSVVSFPEGKNSVEDKISEMKQLLSDGADEIDVVWNYHQKENFDYLKQELKQLNEIKLKNTTLRGSTPILKIIVESGLLTNEETKIATEMCLETGVDFIKTSTGKIAIGAELEKVKIMRETISMADLKIKASGGIRTQDQFEAFLPFVDRFGIGFASVDQMNGLEGETLSNLY